MHLSKKTRILLLIAVDTAFFFLEIIIGYTAHSLALVADAFHMLNDIISLCVGYWATDVAENRSSSTDYTYGWARAEILGGLVNGVFLIALCVTIVLEAIQRFFEIQEVSNPRLVLIVGGVGLAFNILGLFLFHQHDHGHGEEHDHSHGDELDGAEAGHAIQASHTPHMPHASHDHEHGHSHNHDHPAAPKSKQDQIASLKNVGKLQLVDESTSLLASNGNAAARQKRGHRRSTSRNYDSIENLPIHPASLRNDMRAQARMEDPDYSSSEDALMEEDEGAIADDDMDGNDIESPIKTADFRRRSTRRRSYGRRSRQVDGSVSGKIDSKVNGVPFDHGAHKHALPKTSKSHGHSHDENIRGMFLHVLGDALGNVGVMASALIIWLSDWKYRFYFDPIISLFITLIILKSAIPLVRDTAKPLLQATPEDINVEYIQQDIESLPGVRSCHHIHVWALTRSRLIATLDVQLDFDFENKSGTKRWMDLAMEIKSCLHGFNIHSSTIQPEFCIGDHDHGNDGTADESDHGGSGGGVSTSKNHGHHDHDHDHSQGRDEHEHNHAHHDGAEDDHGPNGKTCGCAEGECLLDDACGAAQCCGPVQASDTTAPKRSDAHAHN